MRNWAAALMALHVIVAVAGGVLYLRYWRQTKFWLPRYVHYLAAVALVVGVFAVWTSPPGAPINRGRWRDVKRTLMAISLPALVYGWFVIHGGQLAAHERMHPQRPCLHCGKAAVTPGTSCPHCGQSLLQG